jgi:hypothetical protein
MTKEEANKVRIGSLVQYTHIGRWETEKCLGLVTSETSCYAQNMYADVHWFDGTSHGVHPLLNSNLSLINA